MYCPNIKQSLFDLCTVCLVLFNLIAYLNVELDRSLYFYCTCDKLAPGLDVTFKAWGRRSSMPGRPRSNQNCKLQDQQTQPKAANPLPHMADQQPWFTNLSSHSLSHQRDCWERYSLFGCFGFFKQNEKNLSIRVVGGGRMGKDINPSL